MNERHYNKDSSFAIKFHFIRLLIYYYSDKIIKSISNPWQRVLSLSLIPDALVYLPNVGFQKRSEPRSACLRGASAASASRPRTTLSSPATTTLIALPVPVCRHHYLHSYQHLAANFCIASSPRSARSADDSTKNDSPSLHLPSYEPRNLTTPQRPRFPQLSPHPPRPPTASALLVSRSS
jgi:hypothetical protein